MKTLCNYNLNSVHTPVNVRHFEELLVRSEYDPEESQFLLGGFTSGFSIGYEGPVNRQDTSANIPFRIGNKRILWDKLMTEIEASCFAGPYNEPPFEYFVQSPIGLVPKANGKTQLIFHLSYNFGQGEGARSINACTPKEKCSVKYHNLDYAVELCLRMLAPEEEADANQLIQEDESRIWLAKSDLRSAFRMLPIKKDHRKFLLLKAEHPETGQVYFFVDKCLPFGASISCSHFQCFSDALHHIVEFVAQVRNKISNYLDDYLFLERAKWLCNRLVTTFLEICEQINFPVAEDKTEWASPMVIFLGMLLDGLRQVIAVPENKRSKALTAVSEMVQKSKTTVKDVQSLAGLLNFLTRTIVPGRVFTQRMYSKYATIMTPDGKKLDSCHLKPHQHIKVDAEFRADCQVWKIFLQDPYQFARPFVDFKKSTFSAQDLNFQTDASKNALLGFGCRFGKEWAFGQWEPGFIRKHDPSIAYLELFALCVGVFIWSEHMINKRIIVYCDNQAVVNMINSTASSCPRCMQLLRLLILKTLKGNFRIFAIYISTHDNEVTDSLSRLDSERFRKIAVDMAEFPEDLPSELWPLSRLWD